MGRALQLVLLGFILQWFAVVLPSQVEAAETCDEANVQTAAQNRLKAGNVVRRGVGIFFAGASANALPEAEKRLIEAELDRFFQAFDAVFSPHAYFWSAQPELLRQKQARFDYLVVVDAELNMGSLPKYDEYLSSYKGKPIDDDMLAVADYPMPRGQRVTPPYAFIQIVDTGPHASYAMLAEFILLVLGAELRIDAGEGYYETLSEYVAGDVSDAGVVASLQQTHDMIVYGCLAPVFKK